MNSLTLDVITPRGHPVHETGLDEVVLRRREDAHDPGSEIAVLPGHAPMLVRTCEHDLRFRRGDVVRSVRTAAGVAEVLGGTVTVLVPSAKGVSRG